MVTQNEIIEALCGECNGFKRDMLADRIEAEGIAPPDGMVLVPSEPTDEMADSAIQHLDDDPDPQYYFKVNTAKEVYKAMLATAPKGVSDEQ